MLEELRKELHGLIAFDVDLVNLTHPDVVNKSQELDIEINKAMYKKIASLKRA